MVVYSYNKQTSPTIRNKSQKHNTLIENPEDVLCSIDVRATLRVIPLEGLSNVKYAKSSVFVTKLQSSSL